MRHVAVILAVAFAGIHCASQADPVGETTGENEVVASGDKRPHAAPGDVPIDDDGSESATASEGAAIVVTSSVMDASGSTYSVGTFTGSVTLGGVRLRSRGDKDVFLTKTRPDGEPVWALAIGSRRQESAPRVSLEAETGRVTVVGMTEGEMDCGDGPLATFAETFFLCTFLGSDGAALVSAAFPTGRL